MLDWEERFSEKIEGEIKMNVNIKEKVPTETVKKDYFNFPTIFHHKFSCRRIPFNNTIFYNRESKYCFALRDKNEPSMNYSNKCINLYMHVFVCDLQQESRMKKL